jgi:hypothetical protein
MFSELGTNKVSIAGGTGVVSPGIENQLISLYGAPAVKRFAGSDRFGTASAINRQFFPNATKFFVASGSDFPDALGAAPVAAMQGSPLYLTERYCMPRSAIMHMVDANANTMIVVGGFGVVDPLAAAFRNCW